MGRASQERRALAIASIAAAAIAPLSVIACGTGGAVDATTSSGSTVSSTSAGEGGDRAERDAAGGGGSGGARDAGRDHDLADAIEELPPSDAACNTREMGFDLAAGVHVPICSYIDWPTNPPTSGEHYPVWAAYRAYDRPVPRGFYVHDEEHGGIVVAYNCPDGCAAEVAALEAFVAARPADPSCVAPVHARVVITPDPLLDVRFAAAAWGFWLKSDCFDLAALGAFIDAHYEHGPEDFCDDGIDPTSPDAGLPSDCGAPPNDGG